jgi:ribosomal protein S18 acetylase RimI-like enzyme
MTVSNITILPPSIDCAAQCEPILRALPEWFGIEKSLLEYVEAAKKMPTMLVMDGDQTIGFLTINRHFPESAEIHCMAILPTHHRMGIGRQMIIELEKHLVAEHVQFLQVKTVAQDREDENYARTRAFYLSMDFKPLEVFPTLWDPRNPCLLLVKSL